MSDFHPFALHQRVSKIGGDYRFEGTIVAVFHKMSGKARYVVENNDGLLFIFNHESLRPRILDSTGSEVRTGPPRFADVPKPIKLSHAIVSLNDILMQASDADLHIRDGIYIMPIRKIYWDSEHRSAVVDVLSNL